MDQERALLILQLSSLSVFIPGIFALLRIKKGSIEQKTIAVLVLLSVLIEILADYMAETLKISNLPLLHIFTIFEFALIFLAFQKAIKDYLSLKKIVLLISVFSIFSILNSIFHEPLNQFNAFARAIEALLIILIVLLYFYATMMKLAEKHLEQSPLFWFSSGLLLYFSATLFIFIYSNIIFGTNQNSFLLWALHGVINIIRYTFYTIALWIKPKT